MKDYGHNITESKLRVGGSAVQVRKINFKKYIFIFWILGHFCGSPDWNN